jgi:hypothetical protein
MNPHAQAVEAIMEAVAEYAPPLDKPVGFLHEFLDRAALLDLDGAENYLRWLLNLPTDTPGILVQHGFRWEREPNKRRREILVNWLRRVRFMK